MIQTLKGEKVILRRPRYDDILSYHYYASHSMVGPNAGWLPHGNLDESKAALKFLIIEKLTWAITTKDDVLIGTIGLYDLKLDKEKSCYIGFSLNYDFWNQGIMTEALKLVLDYLLNQLKFNKIYASCYEDNFRSQSLLKKFGFSKINERLEYQLIFEKEKMVYDYMIERGLL